MPMRSRLFLLLRQGLHPYGREQTMRAPLKPVPVDGIRVAEPITGEIIPGSAGSKNVKDAIEHLLWWERLSDGTGLR